MSIRGDVAARCYPLVTKPYLIIDIADVLLTFPVHIQDLQKRFVDSLICSKSCLQTRDQGKDLLHYKVHKCRCSTEASMQDGYLDFVHIVDGLVKLHRLLGLRLKHR